MDKPSPYLIIIVKDVRQSNSTCLQIFNDVCIFISFTSIFLDLVISLFNTSLFVGPIVKIALLTINIVFLCGDSTFKQQWSQYALYSTYIPCILSLLTCCYISYAQAYQLCVLTADITFLGNQDLAILAISMLLLMPSTF